MRKHVWKFHSWLGLAAGLGLLIIGLSGSLLVFRHEVDALLGQAAPRVTPQPAHASLDTVVAALLARYPDLEIFSWYGSDRPDEPHRISGTLASTRAEFDILFNPYTGALLEKPQGQSGFTNWLLNLHVSLLLSTPGVVLAGLFAAALVLSGLSGAYLYREFWKRFFTLRWRASGRILFSDLHKFIGISSVAFNLILGFSGAWWNLPAVRDLFARSAGEDAPAKPALPPLPMPLEEMKASAQKQLPGFQPRALRYPSDGDNFYNVRGGVPTWNLFASGWGDEVHLDPATGTVTRVLELHQAGVWAQFEDMLTPLHFGTFGGLPIKLLWCLGGLTPGILGVSGFLIRRSRVPPRPARRIKPTLEPLPVQTPS
jgi:uncharacterized iron-regulated membrane protein